MSMQVPLTNYSPEVVHGDYVQQEQAAPQAMYAPPGSPNIPPQAMRAGYAMAQPMMSAEAVTLQNMFAQKRAELGRPGLRGEKAGELQQSREGLCQRVGNRSRPSPPAGKLFKAEERLCKPLRGMRVRVLPLETRANGEVHVQPAGGMLSMLGMSAPPLEDEMLQVSVELTEKRLLISTLSEEPMCHEADFNGQEVAVSPVPQADSVTVLRAGYATRFKLMNYPLSHIFTVQCSRHQGVQASTIASLHVCKWPGFLVMGLGTIICVALVIAGLTSSDDGLVLIVVGCVVLVLFVAIGGLAIWLKCCLDYKENPQPEQEVNETLLQFSAVDPSRQRLVQVVVTLVPSTDIGDPLPEAIDFVESATNSVCEDNTHVSVTALKSLHRRKPVAQVEEAC